MTTPRTTPKLLRIYLNDHLAGAAAGVRLANRAARSNRGNALGRYLSGLAEELEAARAGLVSIMERLGVAPDPIRQVAVRVAEIAGRAKLNGRITSYSPLSRLEELEFLSLGLEGQISMWRSLQEVQPKLPAIADADFAALIANAEGQRKQIEDFRARAARQALLSD
jgi:hypothetical protein